MGYHIAENICLVCKLGITLNKREQISWESFLSLIKGERICPEKSNPPCNQVVKMLSIDIPHNADSRFLEHDLYQFWAEKK